MKKLSARNQLKGKIVEVNLMTRRFLPGLLIALGVLALKPLSNRQVEELVSMTEASVTDATDTTTPIRHVTSIAKHHAACCSADGATMTAPIAHQELLGLGRGRKANLAGGLPLTMTRALGILA